MSAEFFQTRMGQTFYERTMPALAASAASIALSLKEMAEQNRLAAEAMTRLAAAMEKSNELAILDQESRKPVNFGPR